MPPKKTSDATSSDFQTVIPCDKCTHSGLCMYEKDMRMLACDLENQAVPAKAGELKKVLKNIALCCVRQVNMFDIREDWINRPNPFK